MAMITKRMFRPMTLLCAVLFFFLFSGRGTGAERAPSKEPLPSIPRLIQESPGFSDHPQSNGIVWLRKMHYSLEADGSLTRTSTRVILAKRGISEEWTRWTFPATEGTSVEVLSAALYDPGTGGLLAPVIPLRTEKDGIPVVEIFFPDVQEEFIILLSLKEVFARKFAVEDLLWLNEELPQWEQSIIVDVSSGSELAIASSGTNDPKKEKAGPVDRYTWHIMNSPAWSGRTLKSGARSFLSFSTHKGPAALALALESLEKRLLPSPPRGAQSVINSGNKLKAGYALMEWLRKAPAFPPSFPPSFVRADIPAEGPWTEWEKVLLLNRWIRSAGWESKLSWVAAHPLDEKSPASLASVLRPVAELNYQGVSPFYYDFGALSLPGETPPSLWGQYIYTRSETGLEGHAASGSSAAEHRLSIEWVLDLDKEGKTSGKVTFFVRNGWVAFFFPRSTPDDVSIARMARELFPDRRFAEGSAEVKAIKYGWQITLPAEEKQSIVSGGAMLVPFPGATPSWIAELGRSSGSYRMAFPFVAEQKFILRLPPKTDVVALPDGMKRELEKVRYEETAYYNKRRNTITAESKIVLSADEITEGIGRGLAEGAQRWMAYSAKTLPLRIR
ncbi:MAG: hypothetical protein GX791_01005 [Synergistaceae bacterium]|nr:hypothetical protein [Synergistaceae bacterium]